MNSTEIPSVQWLSVVRDAFAKTDGSVKTVFEALTVQLSAQETGGSIAAAFAEGLMELAAYADKKMSDTATAVDAEAEAITASRRIVRPVLQAKLQARINSLA